MGSEEFGICYWPDGVWCMSDELQDFYWKSDDYTRDQVPSTWDDTLIAEYVEEKVNGL